MGDSDVGSVLNVCLLTLRQAKDERAVDKIPCDTFRRVVLATSRLGETGNALLPPCLAELADLMLYCLSVTTMPIDTQTVASSAFCLILSLIQEPHSIALMFSKTFLTSNDHLRIKLSKSSELSLSITRPDVFKLCLTHGLLQTDNFWTNGHVLWEKLLKEKLFSLIEKHCFQYSHLTLLAFKSLVSWIKRCEVLSNPLPQELMSRMAAVIISNWENPFNGVREQNAIAFNHLLLMAETSDDTPPLLKPNALLQLVLAENSWMKKSKYFLLTALLPRCGVLKTLLEESDDIVYGLITSLSYSHLAPAGTDLYKVIIDSISLDQWEQTFLKPITDVLISSKYVLQKQNVFNYWLPCTIKKFKIALQILLDTVTLSGQSESVVLPIVCCLKLGRKEGYDNMSWQNICNSTYLLRGLKHHDPLVRAHSFSTVCVSSKTSIVPTDDEFIAVETFLIENINSDNQALRQSILNSFTAFLCRVRDASVHILKTKYQHDPQFENRALTRSMTFLEWLYSFLKSNLEIGVNYQRKIASLELYKIVLNYLASENNHNQRKSNLKSEGHRLMKYAIGANKWGFTSDRSREILLYCISDPSEDVRETAAEILTSFFKMGEGEGPRFAELYKKGLSLCSDMMFYNADAGALLIYVLVCLTYKAGVGPKALDVKSESVSESLLNLAETQSIELRGDLLKATTSGSPLYGLLQALYRLLTDPSSPEFQSLDQPQLSRLNALVDEVVRHLLQILASKSTSITDYAPSFREMGEEIENTIQESTVSVEESDKLHLSPAHQLVLNSIWTNLKACCALSSKLSGCENSVRVLRHCRHKGAVEAAGQALAEVTKNKPAEGELPLCQALDRLSAGQTQSSRGAGGVVLVHRLVASDSRLGRPMVDKALSHILSLVERKTGDLAQCLHILTSLLKDSSLSQDTARYLHRITPAAFACLSHSSWPVRNAALQLFGSIVPKLVGQKKQNDEDKSCSCYHLAYEELYYHCMPLVNTILDCLENATSAPPNEALLMHSKLVPVLTLLSNLSVGLLTIIDRSLEGVFHKFVGSFQLLMSSRVCKVRELAAKANAWFCSISQIGNLVRTRVWKIVAYVNDPTLENEIKSENELHGFLLNTKFLVTKFNEEKEGMKALRSQGEVIKESLDELKPIQNSPKISYLCRCILKELCGYDFSVTATKQMEDLLLLQSPTHKDLGLPQWICQNSQKIIESCPLSELLPTLNIAINSNNLEIIESCLTGIERRITKLEFEAVSNGAVNSLFRFVTNQLKARDTNKALEVILEIMCRYEITPINLNVDNLIENLISEDCPVGIAVMCGLVRFKKDIDSKLVDKVVKKLCSSCSPTTSLDRRRYAVKGLVLLAPIMLESATEDCLNLRAKLWEAGVTLLQDECPLIRHDASKFANALTAKPDADILNPYSSLIFLHEESTMMSLFPPKQIIACLWSELMCTSDELDALEEAATIMSPFMNSTPNAYQETVKIVDVSKDRLYSLIRKDREVSKLMVKEQVIPVLKNLRDHCIKFVMFSEEYAVRNPVLINREWYIIAKKLENQFKIINFINNSGLDKDFEMFQYRFQSYIEHVTFKC
ncbi:tRNA (32-2'-O)-methyltransferase regulator THADA [Halyomorpha halys]|uniref:tRNA (32-2'-O)-methyltransferase regulator THADA n=1 Tax=Halyomorpha halys TaxID=286706 RepID=UPI0006D51782|nr:uncharacterized protein LOC106687062 [Halyomorpha halys]XP_014286229.1 uncharacterized protein LOC106687062 [Halyomorpha halys]